MPDGAPAGRRGSAARRRRASRQGGAGKGRHPRPAGRPRFPHQLSFQYDDAIQRLLLDRGARRDRGERGLAATLRRLLARYGELVRRLDPVLSGDFPAELLPPFVALVRAPWRLSAFEIGLLDRVISDDPRLVPCAAEHQIAPDVLVAAVRRLSYAQRLALVDRAEIIHASGREET